MTHCTVAVITPEFVDLEKAQELLDPYGMMTLDASLCIPSEDRIHYYRFQYDGAMDMLDQQKRYEAEEAGESWDEHVDYEKPTFLEWMQTMNETLVNGCVPFDHNFVFVQESELEDLDPSTSYVLIDEAEEEILKIIEVKCKYKFDYYTPQLTLPKSEWIKELVNRPKGLCYAFIDYLTPNIELSKRWISDQDQVRFEDYGSEKEYLDALDEAKMKMVARLKAVPDTAFVSIFDLHY